MLKSWAITKGGMLENEYGFALLKEGGSYGIVFSQNSNQYRRVWVPVPSASIAVFHVHPNSVPPEPSRGDIEHSKRIGIPICTITSQGVYCYFPKSQKTIKLQGFPEWTKPGNTSVSSSNL
jgi:hypothetical protein